MRKKQQHNIMSSEKLVSPNVFNNIFPCNELSFYVVQLFRLSFVPRTLEKREEKKPIKNGTLMKRINCILSDLIASICERCGFFCDKMKEKMKWKKWLVLEKSLINYLWYLVISNCNSSICLRWRQQIFSFSLSTKNRKSFCSGRR